MLSCIFAFALPLTAAAQITQSKPMPEHVTVKVNAAGNAGQVSDLVFGTFLEPIDYSLNNGVMAEVLTNGSLEGGLWNHAMLEEYYRDQPELIESSDRTGIPLPWKPLNREAGNRYELHVGDAANSWQSLEILGLSGELTGIAQRVYLPIPRTFGYNVSLYAKHVSGPTKLSVSLRSESTNEAIASVDIDVSAERWTKYTAKLVVPKGSVHRLEPVSFAVSVEGTERTDVDQISLLPDDAVDGFDPAVVKLAADMHMTELRLGGNFSSYYHWRDGIGPVDERKVMENIAWGIPEYNRFGTDEFLDFCKLIHAEPQFDLNMGSGTPEEAADWVKYIRDHYTGPLVLEMGNELYGRWQVGFPTINEIGPRTEAFSKAVKPLAENATLMATGAVPSHPEKWNAALLTDPPGSFDLITTHYIVDGNHVVKNPYTPDFMAAAVYAVPHQVGIDFDRMQKQIDSTPGYKGKVHLAITEWLFNSKGTGERNFTNETPMSRNEGGAVALAASFNTFFRHNDQVKLVDMTGLMEFHGIWKRKEQVFVSPSYYVFQMYSAGRGQTVVPVTSDSGTYNVKGGNPSYAEVSDVPYIDVVATRSKDGKTLTLFCVNRSLTMDVPTSFDLSGFHAQGAGEVEQITAASRYMRNDEVEPHQVYPQPSRITIASDHNPSITLSHESVTVIRLHAR